MQALPLPSKEQGLKQRPAVPDDSDDNPLIEEPRGFASPPCLRHEIDPAYGGDSLEDDSRSYHVYDFRVSLSENRRINGSQGLDNLLVRQPFWCSFAVNFVRTGRWRRLDGRQFQPGSSTCRLQDEQRYCRTTGSCNYL